MLLIQINELKGFFWSATNPSALTRRVKLGRGKARMVSRKPIEPSRIACRAVENPLTTFTRLLRQQLCICDELEKIADNLPDRFDRKQCAELARTIPETLSLVHLVQDGILFPALLQHSTNHHFTRQTAQRLSDEHLTDQGYAFEVCELLQCLISNQPHASLL